MDSMTHTRVFLAIQNQMMMMRQESERQRDTHQSSYTHLSYVVENSELRAINR